MKITATYRNAIVNFTTTLLIAAQWITVSTPAMAQVNATVESEPKQSDVAPDSLTKSSQMRGPDSDFSVWMPGEITRNTSETLVSYSAITGTTYGMLHFDLDYSVSGMTYTRLSEVVYDTLSDMVNGKGVVVDSQGYEIDGLPVWEVTAVESDGKRAKHRLFIRGRRAYYRFAVTSTRFSGESRDFFNSFSLARY